MIDVQEIALKNPASIHNVTNQMSEILSGCAQLFGPRAHVDQIARKNIEITVFNLNNKTTLKVLYNGKVLLDQIISPQGMLISECRNKLVELESLQISVDGHQNITVGTINNLSTLSLKTPGNILFTGPVCLRHLNAQAKKIAVYDILDIDQKCHISVTHRFDNFGHITVCRRLTFQVADGCRMAKIQNFSAMKCHTLFLDGNDVLSFVNHSSMFVTERLSGSTLIFDNRGKLLTKNLKVDLGRKSQFGKAIMKNTGMLVTKNNCYVYSQGWLINDAEWKIGGHFQARTRRFENRATLCCSGLFELNISKSALNGSGAILQSNDRCRLSGKFFEFINKGHIFAECTLAISSDLAHVGDTSINRNMDAIYGVFCNAESGVVESSMLTLSLGQLKNYGRVNSKELGMQMMHHAKSYNAVGAEIAAKNIHLLTEANFTDHGKIIAQKYYKGDIGGGFKLKNTAISIPGQVSMRSLNELVVNNSEIDNDGGYTLASAGHISIKNKSLISSKKTVTLSGPTVHLEDSSLITVEDTTIKGAKFYFDDSSILSSKASVHFSLTESMIIEGTIEAVGDIIAQHYPSMTIKPTASMLAGKSITLMCLQLLNQGSLAAKKSVMLKIIARFTQSASARAMAESCLSLLASNADIQGEIAAQQTLLVDAVEDICLKLGAKLNSKSVVKLIARDAKVHGAVDAEQQILIDAVKQWTLSASGRLDAKKISTQSMSAQIEGEMHADSLVVDAKGSIEVLTNALLKAGSDLELDARVMNNAGKLEAFGRFKAKIGESLHIRESGKVMAHDALLIDVGDLLENIGVMMGGKESLIEAGVLIKNSANAMMSLTENGLLKSGWMLENFGRIDANDTLSIEAQNAIINYQNGRIDAKTALSLISTASIANSGQLSGSQIAMVADVAISNSSTGKISAQNALSMIGAQMLVNAGDITSTKGDIEIDVKQIFENCQDGSMSAAQSISIVSELLIEQAGRLEARLIGLKAKSCLNLIQDSINKADDSIVYRSDVLNHAGNSSAPKIDARAIVHQNNGTYDAAISALIQGDQSLINNDTIKAADVNLMGQIQVNNKSIDAEILTVSGKNGSSCANTFFNNGEVNVKHQLSMDSKSLHNFGLLEAGTLRMAVKDLFINFAEGKITASEAIQSLGLIKNIQNDGKIIAQGIIYLMAETMSSPGEISSEKDSIRLIARDLMITGNLNAARDALLVVKNNFIYDSAVFRVDGMLQLILKDGSVITHAIGNSGGLSLGVLSSDLAGFQSSLEHSLNFSANFQECLEQTQQFFDSQRARFDYLQDIVGIDDSSVQCTIETLKNNKELLYAATMKIEEVQTPFGGILKTYYQFLDAQPTLRQSLGLLSKAVSLIALDGSTLFISQLSDLLHDWISITDDNQVVVSQSTDRLTEFLKNHPKLCVLYLEFSAVLQEANLRFKDYVSDKPFWSQHELSIDKPPFSNLRQGEPYKKFINDKEHLVRDLIFTMPGHIVINNVDLNLAGDLACSSAGYTNNKNIRAQTLTVESTHAPITMNGERTYTDIQQQVHLKASHSDINHQGELYAKDLIENAPHGKIHQKKGQTVISNHSQTNARQFVLDEAATRSAETLLISFKKAQIGGTQNKQLSEIQPYQPVLTGRNTASDHLPDYWSQMGGLYSGSSHIEGSEAMVTGCSYSRDDQFIAIDHLNLEKRQHRSKKTFQDTYKKKVCGFSRKKKKTKTLELFESLPGAELISENGKITRSGKVHILKGGHVSGQTGTYANTTQKTQLLPRIDVSARTYHGKAGNTFGSSSSRVTLARPQVQPSTITSAEGEVRELTEGELISIATQFIAKKDVIVHSKSWLKLLSQVNTVELAPQHIAKGMSCGMVTGTQDVGVANELTSLEGNVVVGSEDNIESHATSFMAEHDIQVEGASLFFAPVVLEQRLKSKVSGMNGFTYFSTKTQSDSQTAMVNSAKAGGNISFRATSADNTQISTQAQAGQHIELAANQGTVFIKDQVLRHQIKEKTCSFGLSFFGSKAIEASMRGDFAMAAQSLAENFLPPLSSIDSYLKASSVSEKQKSGIRAVYESYKLFDAYSKAKDLTDFAKGQISTRVGLSFNKQSTDRQWMDLALPWLQARQVILSAGENIQTTGLTLGESVESLYAQAKRDIHMSAAQTSSSYRSRSSGFNLGFDAGNLVDVGVNWAKANQTSNEFIANHLRTTQSLFFDAGGELNLEGVYLETLHASIQAEKFYATTLQDTVASKNSSRSFNTSGAISVGKGYENKKWSNTQAGLYAKETLVINIEKMAHLKGAVLLLGDDVLPQIALNDAKEQTHFYEHPIPEDGDCGFHALGVPRNLAVQQLMEKLDDQSILQAISADFLAALYANDLSGALLTDELQALKNAWDAATQQIDACVRLLNNQYLVIQNANQWLAQENLDPVHSQNLRAVNTELVSAQNQIKLYTQNPEHARDFIRVTLMDEKAFLSYLPSEHSNTPGSIMDAIAKINHLEVRVWVKRDQDDMLVLNHHYIPSKVERVIDLKHTNDLTHFNLLAKQRGVVYIPDLTHENVYDRDKAKQVNVGVGAAIFSCGYDAHDRKQVNRATISKGIHVVTQSDMTDLNREASRKQSITKNKSVGFGVEVPLELLKKADGKTSSSEEGLDVDGENNEKESESVSGNDVKDTQTQQESQTRQSLVDACKELSQNAGSVSSDTNSKDNTNHSIGQFVDTLRHFMQTHSAKSASILDEVAELQVGNYLQEVESIINSANMTSSPERTSATALDNRESLFKTIDGIIQKNVFDVAKLNNECRDAGSQSCWELCNSIENPFLKRLCQVGALIVQVTNDHDKLPENYRDVLGSFSNGAHVVKVNVKKPISRSAVADNSTDHVNNSNPLHGDTQQLLLPKPKQTLSGNQQLMRNIERFRKKLPNDSEILCRRLPSGNFKLSAQVPGRVPGSRADYIKMVDAKGSTFFVAKNTYDHNNILVHTKKKNLNKPESQTNTIHLPDLSKK